MGDVHARGAHDMAAPAARRSTRRAPVQRKMMVGASNDPAELEADQIADAVMRSLDGGSAERDGLLFAVDTRIGRRSAAAVGDAGGDVPPETDAGIRSAMGGGRPLGGRVRRAMETGFGADFSSVRVHTDERAAGLNDKLQARAFTTGRDIFFSAGQYAPASRSGQQLLAHELAHVVQQGHAGTARRRTVVRRDRSSTGTAGQPSLEQASAGGGRSRITMRDADGEVGSVTVSASGGSAEATALSVSPGRRGQGHGADLLAAAAQRAEASGSSSLAVGSEDSGSGQLDGWYRSLGFREAGSVDGEHTRFEAPTSVLRRAMRAGSTRIIRRMEAAICWYERVPGQSDPVGRTTAKPPPGKFKVVGKHLSLTLWESKEVGKAARAKEDEKRAAAKSKKEAEQDAARRAAAAKAVIKAAAKRAVITPPARVDDYRTIFVLDSDIVCFSQDSISDEFTDGSSIDTLRANLDSGASRFTDLPPLRLVVSEGGNYVSLDNRRLWCCKGASVAVRCRWATSQEAANEGYKFSAGAEGSHDIYVRRKL